MEKYVKPNMEVVDIKDNDFILTSVNDCGSGILGYGGGSGGCSAEGGMPR